MKLGTRRVAAGRLALNGDFRLEASYESAGGSPQLASKKQILGLAMLVTCNINSRSAVKISSCLFRRSHKRSSGSFQTRWELTKHWDAADADFGPGFERFKRNLPREFMEHSVGGRTTLITPKSTLFPQKRPKFTTYLWKERAEFLPAETGKAFPSNPENTPRACQDLPGAPQDDRVAASSNKFASTDTKPYNILQALLSPSMASAFSATARQLRRLHHLCGGQEPP